MKLTTPAKDAKSKEKIEPHKAKPLASAAAGKPMAAIILPLKGLSPSPPGKAAPGGVSGGKQEQQQSSSGKVSLFESKSSMLSTTSAPLGTNPSNADLVPVPAGLLEKKKADKNAKKKHKKKSKKAKAGGKSSASTAKSTASSTTKKKPVHEEEESSDDMPKKIGSAEATTPDQQISKNKFLEEQEKNPLGLPDELLKLIPKIARPRPGEPRFQLELIPEDYIVFQTDHPTSEIATFDVRLNNTTTLRQAFKIKCTNNAMFRVRPPMSFLNPGESTVINFNFMSKVMPDPARQVFCIYHIAVPPEDTRTAKEVFANATKFDGIKRMPLKFIKEDNMPWEWPPVLPPEEIAAGGKVEGVGGATLPIEATFTSTDHKQVTKPKPVKVTPLPAAGGGVDAPQVPAVAGGATSAAAATAAGSSGGEMAAVGGKSTSKESTSSLLSGNVIVGGTSATVTRTTAAGKTTSKENAQSPATLPTSTSSGGAPSQQPPKSAPVVETTLAAPRDGYGLKSSYL